MAVKKIGVLTGGGDAPGLNAVLYTLVKTCILKYDYELIGYKFGYRGLYKNDFMKLDLGSVAGILHKGGTILYSSNKDNLFKYPVRDENGDIVKKNGGEKASKDEKLRKDLVEELADVLMYYNDVLLCYDITPEELKQAYTEKFERNMTRWKK